MPMAPAVTRRSPTGRSSAIPPRRRSSCSLQGRDRCSDTRKAYPRVAEVPFDSAYKYMATFHRMQLDGGREVIRAYVKGAPDVVLGFDDWPQCPGHAGANRVPPRTRARGNDWLASEGLRVLAVAYRDFDPNTFDPSGDLLSQVKDLTLVAFVGIVDPPRKEARDAIALCKSADPGAHDYRRPRDDGGSDRQAARYRGSSGDRQRVRGDE